MTEQIKASYLKKKKYISPLGWPFDLVGPKRGLLNLLDWTKALTFVWDDLTTFKQDSLNGSSLDSLFHSSSPH